MFRQDKVSTRKPLKWTPEFIEKAREVCLSDVHPREASEKLGVSLSALLKAHQTYDLGLMPVEDRMLQGGHYLYTLNSLKGQEVIPSNKALRFLHTRVKCKHPDIQIEELIALTSQRCFVCNNPPSCVLTQRGDKVVYNGLDASRRPICKECGRLSSLIKGKEQRVKMLLGL